jgi:hypothetical protein
MTLNQKYKSSGSNLSFKDWVETQKNLGLVAKKNDCENMNIESNNVNFDVNYRGITQKQVLIAVGILAIVGVGFWAYKKYKK